MERSDLMKGVCPRCGEALEIPSHLKQFSCMYCGSRLTADDIAPKKNVPVISEDEGAAAAAYYKEHILSLIVDHRTLERSLSKNAYAPAIEGYADTARPVFEQLNLAILSGSLTSESASVLLMDQLEEQWDKDVSTRKPRRAKSYYMDTDKFLIAIFLVPMIRTLELATMDDFCTAFHAEWIRRYPKSMWQVGDFEAINKGFKKKFLGLCFITSAVCLQDQKPDDCAELTAFRSFRDGYLRSCPDGPALIDEYYQVAPAIVLAIEKSDDRDERYAAIRETWLEPCFRDLQTGALCQCKERYTDMIRALQQEYLS